MEQIDVAVIGAGVTGLAAALSVAADGRSVCVLERHPRPGLDTSTHNSGVIHGGIYYPAGTLKSRLCIEGRPLLYEFCNRHHVPFERCGKLIVGGAGAYYGLIGRFDAAPSRLSKLTTLVQIVFVLADLLRLSHLIEMPDAVRTGAIAFTALLTFASGAHYVVVWSARAWQRTHARERRQA